MNSSNLDAIDNLHIIKIKIKFLYSLISARDVESQPIDSHDLTHGLTLMISDILEQLDEISSFLSKDKSEG